MKKSKTSFKLSILIVGPAILAFMITIFMFVYVYSQFQESMLKSMNDQNIYFTDQVGATTRFADEVLMDIANQIFYDSQVARLRTETELTNNEQIEGIRKINSITATNTMIDSIYVYNGNLDYIFSTSQYGAVNDTADSFKDTVAADMFHKRLQENRLVLIPRKTYTAKGYSDSDLYSFIYFENNSDGTTGNNAIMMNLRSATFAKLYIGANPEVHACIINDKGDLISASNLISQSDRSIVLPEILQRNESGIESGYFKFKNADDEKSVCFFSKMANHSWISIKLLQYDELFGEVLHAKRITMSILGAIIAVLVCIFIFVAQFLYIPFIRITGKMTRNSNPTQMFQELGTLIDESNDPDSMSSKLKESFLRDILTGAKKYDSHENNLEKYALGIVIDFPIWLYLVSGSAAEHLNSIQEIIPYSEAVRFGDEYSMLLLQPTSKEQIHKIRKFLSSVFPASYHIISQEIRYWSRLPDFYQMMYEKWMLRFLNPDQKVLFVEFNYDKNHSMASLSEKSAAVISDLKKGISSKVQIDYDEFIRELGAKSYNTVRIALINLGNAVIKLEHKNTGQHLVERECAEFVNMIDRLDDIRTVNHFFFTAFDEVIQEQQRDIQSRHIGNMQVVSDFIDQNFRDPQLSTKLLADQFGLSAPYLARVFKHSSGQSVQSYINAVRINYAKTLLAEKHLKISEVTDAVGIINRQYFFKLFKTLTGETPLSYQSRHGNRNIKTTEG